MKKLLVSAMLAMLMICGCVTVSVEPDNPEITYNENIHNGTQMWLLRHNRMWDDETGSTPSRFAFDLEMFAKNGEIEYFIMIDDYSGDKFFIDSGESLVLTVDGEQVKFKTGGAVDNTKLVENCVVRQTAFYILSQKQLKFIAGGKKIKAEIRGYIGYAAAWLGEDNILNIQKFYDASSDIIWKAKER